MSGWIANVTLEEIHPNFIRNPPKLEKFEWNVKFYGLCALRHKPYSVYSYAGNTTSQGNRTFTSQAIS